MCSLVKMLRFATQAVGFVLGMLLLCWSVIQVVYAIRGSESSSPPGATGESVVEIGFLVPSVVLCVVLMLAAFALLIRPGN